MCLKKPLFQGTGAFYEEILNLGDYGHNPPYPYAAINCPIGRFI